MSIPHANIFKHFETIQRVLKDKLGIDGRVGLNDVQEFAGGQTSVFVVPKLKFVFKFEKDQAQQFEGYHGQGIAVQAAAYDAGLSVPRVILPFQVDPIANYYVEELMDGVTFGSLLKAENVSDARIVNIGRQVGQFVASFDVKLGGAGDKFGVASINLETPDFAKAASELDRLPKLLSNRLASHLEKAASSFSTDQVRLRLIHDDLHSGNIMIAGNDMVSIFDFGIVRVAPVEYAFRMLAFRKPPFLESVLAGCGEKDELPFNLPLMAYYSIAQIFNPEMHMSDEKLGVVKMSDAKRAELAENVAANLDILEKIIGYPAGRNTASLTKTNKANPAARNPS